MLECPTIPDFLGCSSMVVNGATKFDDMKHFDKYLAAFKAKGGDVSMEYLHEQNLIALQGTALYALIG
jgi:hypothetical protein